MAKLTPEVRKAIETLGTFPIATATADGKPNLIWIAFLRIIDDETIEIADNRFFKTRENLDANPQIAATFWGPETDGCYQVKGKAVSYTEGDIYDACVEWVHSKNPGLTPKAAVRLSVDEIYSGAEKLA